MKNIISKYNIRNLRKIADSARFNKMWALDAYYRRKVCEISPNYYDNWLQYGHSLKECGFFSLSEKAYLKALDICPNLAEIYFQIGLLKKITGKTIEAEQFYDKSLSLNTDGNDFLEKINKEKNILRSISGNQQYNKNINIDEGITFFLSSSSGKPLKEESTENLKLRLGKADYSYAFALRGFIDVLKDLEYEYHIIDNPEYIPDVKSISNTKLNIHIGFYPPEKIRLIKGAYNINCFAWEFDRLRNSSEIWSGHSFSDQAQMLEICNEIWMPSQHGVDAVSKTIQTPVYRVPSPILDLIKNHKTKLLDEKNLHRSLKKLYHTSWRPLAIFPRIQATMDAQAEDKKNSITGIIREIFFNIPPTIFVSVFNVHDFRKQIRPAIEGFIDLCNEKKDALLILKISSPFLHKASINKLIADEQFYDLESLIPPTISNKVWITTDILTRDEMNALYDMSNFYICTSHAEGQNLPLIEAMSRGVVPISVKNTAMLDYITDENSIVIQSYNQKMSKRLSERYRIIGESVNTTTSDYVLDAFKRASALTENEYITKSQKSLQTVKSIFGKRYFDASIKRIASKFKTLKSAKD